MNVDVTHNNTHEGKLKSFFIYSSLFSALLFSAISCYMLFNGKENTFVYVVALIIAAKLFQFSFLKKKHLHINRSK